VCNNLAALQYFFELSDLVADGAFANAQLFCRQRETQVSRS